MKHILLLLRATPVVPLLVAFLVVLSTPRSIQAGGFQLNEHGARAMAMGFAVASTDGCDVSTIFYNPAGLPFLRDGFSLMIGITPLLPQATFTGPTNLNRSSTTSMDLWAFPLPHLYAAYKVPNSGLAFGLGVFVPFGAGTSWNENWTGRNLALRTYLQTITVNPTIAYAFLDNKISIAVGGTYSHGSAELRQRVPNFGTEPFLNLKGEGNVISWNAGLVLEPVKGLKIGAAYRHNINMKYDGKATFTTDAAGTQALPAGLNNLFADGPGGTALNLPFDLRTGISYRFSEKFMMELGFDYVGWSSYDTLRIRFDKLPGAPSRSGEVINPRNYYNTPTFRLGTEYIASETLKVRGGAFYDVVPVEARYTQPILPDANRIGITAGVGFNLTDNLIMDASYMFVYGLQREVTGSTFGFDGIYNSWANALSVSFSYRF
ncbi:MAG: outer membrane protein transport protein [Ignavibacteria bacterium]|nr:outer membrane protein transport protein [Ignavibacteria bacterium]MBL7989856.1 outer membrane protein transport protein [Candidatus Kapabacteria bacterium]